MIKTLNDLNWKRFKMSIYKNRKNITAELRHSLNVFIGFDKNNDKEPILLGINYGRSTERGEYSSFNSIIINLEEFFSCHPFRYIGDSRFDLSVKNINNDGFVLFLINEKYKDKFNSKNIKLYNINKTKAYNYLRDNDCSYFIADLTLTRSREELKRLREFILTVVEKTTDKNGNLRPYKSYSFYDLFSYHIIKINQLHINPNYIFDIKFNGKKKYGTVSRRKRPGSGKINLKLNHIIYDKNKDDEYIINKLKNVIEEEVLSFFGGKDVLELFIFKAYKGYDTSIEDFIKENYFKFRENGIVNIYKYFLMPYGLFSMEKDATFKWVNVLKSYVTSKRNRKLFFKFSSGDSAIIQVDVPYVVEGGFGGDSFIIYFNIENLGKNKSTYQLYFVFKVNDFKKYKKIIEYKIDKIKILFNRNEKIKSLKESLTVLYNITSAIKGILFNNEVNMTYKEKLNKFVEYINTVSYMASSDLIKSNTIDLIKEIYAVIITKSLDKSLGFKKALMKSLDMKQLKKIILNLKEDNIENKFFVVGIDIYDRIAQKYIEKLKNILNTEDTFTLEKIFYLYDPDFTDIIKEGDLELFNETLLEDNYRSYCLNSKSVFIKEKELLYTELQPIIVKDSIGIKDIII